ncbi:MAG TPA: hypothetical protein VF885_23765 [Arthrobacter sp.]
MADDKPEPEFICPECGITYRTEITMDTCAAVDRRLANGRAIGL